MKQVDLSRRESLRKILIASGSCMVLSSTSAFGSLKDSAKNGLSTISVSNEYALTDDEIEVFTVVKRQMVRSKTVTDEQIVDFSKMFVEQSPAGTDFKAVLSGLEPRLYLMNCFVRFVHV